MFHPTLQKWWAMMLSSGIQTNLLCKIQDATTKTFNNLKQAYGDDSKGQVQFFELAESVFGWIPFYTTKHNSKCERLFWQKEPSYRTPASLLYWSQSTWSTPGSPFESVEKIQKIVTEQLKQLTVKTSWTFQSLKTTSLKFSTTLKEIELFCSRCISK